MKLRSDWAVGIRSPDQKLEPTVYRPSVSGLQTKFTKCQFKILTARETTRFFGDGSRGFLSLSLKLKNFRGNSVLQTCRPSLRSLPQTQRYGHVESATSKSPDRDSSPNSYVQSRTFAEKDWSEGNAQFQRQCHKSDCLCAHKHCPKILL